MSGEQRTCEIEGGGMLEERILSVDPDRRRVAYAITSSPLGMEHHSASMAVATNAAGRTQVTWITDYAPAAVGDHLEPMIDEAVSGMAAALDG